MADRMVRVAALRKSRGFLSAWRATATADGLGITRVRIGQVKKAIAAWKANAINKIAQETGRRVWLFRRTSSEWQS